MLKTQNWVHAMAIDSLFFVAKYNLGSVKHEPMRLPVTPFQACDLH